MSEENKQLVRRALEEIYGRGNLELAEELIHPDFVDLDLYGAHPDGPTGPENGDLSFEIHEKIAEGDTVVQRVTMSGRHSGPLMGPIRPVASSPFSTCTAGGLLTGRIVEHWGSREDLGLLRQLGLLPPNP